MDIIDRLEELLGERELVINSSKGKDMATIREAITTIKTQRQTIAATQEAIHNMVHGHIDKPALRRLAKELK